MSPGDSVDGEKTPSVDVQMEQGMFAVLDPDVPDDPGAQHIKIPWGNERIGRGGIKGGRYVGAPSHPHCALPHYTSHRV